VELTLRNTRRLGIATGLLLLLLLLMWSDGPETVAISTTTQQPLLQVDDGQDQSVTVTLLHNNDGESKLLPNSEAGFPGVARFANEWIAQGRASDSDILLRVSAGDNFLASKEFAIGLERQDQPLYDSIALRGLYEVMALGNHDFDFGPEVTARFIEGFQANGTTMPVVFVSANIDVSDEPSLQTLVEQDQLARSTIVSDSASDLRIGVIGAITPRLPNISSPQNVRVDADVAAAVNAEVAALQSEGINRIVLVSHLQGLAEDQALIAQLSGVDVVVAGGGDELLRNPGDSCQPDQEPIGPYPLLATDAQGNDVPVVTAPGGYRCIGRLEITFTADGQVSKLDGTSIGVALDGEAERFAVSRVEQPLTAALEELDSTVVGTSDVALDGRRSSVRTGATNLGELLADSLLAAGNTDDPFGGLPAVVAVQNGGGIRNDAELPIGEVSASDTFDVAPFANFVVTGVVPREQFRDMLEVAVASLPEPSGTFPQAAGFSMVVDAGQPAREIADDGDCSLVGNPGSRIRSVILDDGTEIVRNGEVVDGEPLTLATIDFLASGGDCYPLADLDFAKTGISYQQALQTYIAVDLGGDITGDQYPVGGSTTAIESDEVLGIQQDAPAEQAQADLAKTGVESARLLIVALTVLAGGTMIYAEAKRAGRISLANRLRANRAWIPIEDADSDESDTSLRQMHHGSDSD